MLPAMIIGTSPTMPIPIGSRAIQATTTTILAVRIPSLISFLGQARQSGACLTSYDNYYDHCKVCEHFYGEFSRPDGRQWCHSK